MVMAFDAATGATLWSSEEEPYLHTTGAGENNKHAPIDGPVCWPDAQGIPLISGDGTVYTSSSHHGDLRAIKDSNNDGVSLGGGCEAYKRPAGQDACSEDITCA